ncbi:VMA21-like domain containing protein [Nitzschia inconspicua]|uniref:VMA21-like domain containing protein n=1 Tax=Nitzschia inconspicua TaxID=303405 RepID=A0A9K3PME8_9STRA|nr:VMA21-like domain containing protein [Nitzschia inconspicua]
MGFSALLHPQNKETGQKLGIATALMFTLPFVAFYISMKVFEHKPSPENWAGAVAIVVTNIIVGGYCYVAYIEDRDDLNDEDGPRKGASKQRVD